MLRDQLADELDLMSGDDLAAVAKDAFHAPEPSRERRRTQAPTPFFSARDAHRSPHRRGSRRGWIPARQQHVELVRLQSLRHRRRTHGPEAEPSPRQTLLTQPKPPPVIRCGAPHLMTDVTCRIM